MRSAGSLLQLLLCYFHSRSAGHVSGVWASGATCTHTVQLSPLTTAHKQLRRTPTSTVHCTILTALSGRYIRIKRSHHTHVHFQTEAAYTHSRSARLIEGRYRGLIWRACATYNAAASTTMMFTLEKCEFCFTLHAIVDISIQHLHNISGNHSNTIPHCIYLNSPSQLYKPHKGHKGVEQ